MSGFVSYLTNGFKLDEPNVAKGYLLGAGIGALGTGILINIGSEVVPQLSQQPYMMLTIVTGGVMGALFLSNSLAAALQVTTIF